MSSYVTRSEEILSSEEFDGIQIELIHEHVEIRLKRCPMCGTPGRAATITDRDGDFLVIQCPQCGVHTALCGDYEPAAELWNSRKKGRSSGRIKPCPFCGGKAQLEFVSPREDVDDDEADDTSGVAVECTECEASTPALNDNISAIETWNRRV